MKFELTFPVVNPISVFQVCQENYCFVSLMFEQRSRVSRLQEKV